jgi:molybdate transport system substrate-binding protein
MWLLLILWLLPARAPAGEPLLVSAAVSLTEALTECGDAFTNRTGIPLTFNFGASNALARQISKGAPVDLFVSADVAQMEYAVRAGAIVRESVSIVAANRLVVIVRGTQARRWASPSPLAAPDVRRIAIGDPAAVPAGVYAKQWLERIGLWSAVTMKLVPAASVRGALAAVRSGAADAGIVYMTDARSATDISVAFEVTGPDSPAIRYPAGIVNGSRRQADARAFLQFLRDPAAQRLLQARGFLAPAARGSR